MLRIARSDAPFASRVREEVLGIGIGVEDVIAVLQIHRHLLDVQRLEEHEMLLVGHTNARLIQRQMQFAHSHPICFGDREFDVRAGERGLRTNADLVRRRERFDVGCKVRDISDGRVDARDECINVAERCAGRSHNTRFANTTHDHLNRERGRVTQLQTGRDGVVVFNRRRPQQHSLLGIARTWSECLVRDVPHQSRQLVAMQSGVVAERGEVIDGTAESVAVAAEVQHAIRPWPAVHAVDGRRQEGLGAALDRGQAIRNELECVVAVTTEQQVAGLPVQSTGNDVVARSAKDPFLARTTHQDVVALTTENHVATNRIRCLGIAFLDHLAGEIEFESDVVDRRNSIGRLHFQHILSAFLQTGERQAVAGSTGQIQCSVGHFARHATERCRADIGP